MPQQCDHNNQLLDQYYIERFSDAASHLWHKLGLTRVWMRENNLGTVAVEMKATRHQDISPGMAVEVVTWPTALGRKTFSFRHQVNDVVSGAALYSGAVTALLLDLKLRKTIELPALLKENARLVPQE